MRKKSSADADRGSDVIGTDAAEEGASHLKFHQTPPSFNPDLAAGICVDAVALTL